MPFMSSFINCGQVLLTTGPALTGDQHGPGCPGMGHASSQNQRSFRNPGTWAPRDDFNANPKPPKIHFLPGVVQVIAKSLPPGVLSSVLGGFGTPAVA